MAARFIRLVLASGNSNELFVRPETIVAFGSGPEAYPGSWIILWATEVKMYVRETCQEIATLLTEGGH
jgi:hypothetical protein